MKLKGKLILSCAALAAVATTAFSTTYAWYTSNSTVSADGIQAGTESGGSDSLQISADAKKWESSVTLTVDTQTLVPVQYGANGNTADGTYHIWNPEGNAPATGNAASGAYCEFNLFFRNPATEDDEAKVYMNQLKITNVTAATALPDTKTLAGEGLIADPTAANVAQKPTYTMDLLRALDLEIVSKNVTVNDGDFIGVVDGDSACLANTAGDDVVVYSLDNYATDDDYTDGVTNAHEYYNAVKGLATGIDTTDKLTTITEMPNLNTAVNTSTSAIEIGTAHDNTYLKTTWRLFINGWDLACFDAIKGQSITFEMNFNTFAA